MAHPAGKNRQLKLRTRLGSRPLGYAGVTLLALAACGAFFVINGRPVSAVPTAMVRDVQAGPEGLLLRTLHNVSNNRLDAAALEIDKVISAYPKFRLAHLIKGDLLLARGRPLTTMGNAPGGSRDQLEDLREEARARLARIHHQRPADLVPSYLVQMQPEQRHAFVVDTARATLYVFANHDGEPRYIADYYATIGKNGVDKNREGDKKTPLGVYHVTGSMPRAKLADLYGAGAFPINYPNEWDRRQGRNGYGIWLHGTPSDTYSRPPRSSDGCVALTNEDLAAIEQTVQIGLTPVIIANGVDWVAPGATRSLRNELGQEIERWRRNWESRDTGKYLAHYSAGFSSGNLDLARWSEQKRKVNSTKTWIKLKLDKMSMFLYPGRNDLAVVTFDQDYASSNLASQMRKRQYWIKEGGAWRILHEGSA